MGLEPMTLRLKVWCSTDWANQAAHKQLCGNENVRTIAKRDVFKNKTESVPSLSQLIFPASVL